MNSEDRADDTEPSEFGLRQFPFTEERPAIERRRLREQYGRVRAYYKARPRRYRDLQEWLNQARYGVSYDVYLARSATYALLSALLGIVLGLAVAWLLTDTGVVAGIRNPLAYDGEIVYFLAAHRTLFAGAALVIAFASVSALSVWLARYHFPRFVVSARRRNIDITLPHAITFMYALSRGGMDLLEVLEVLAENEDTYGEVANESEMIVREVQLFGNDLYTALRNVRNLTPSENFQQFLDDMLSVIDSGGDLTLFLENEAEDYLEEARDQQQSFLETLAVLSEFFVVLFVAAPLFLIVILVVMSLLGSQTLDQLAVIVYALLPLSMLGFLVLLDTLSEPYSQDHVRFADEEDEIERGPALVAAVVRDALGTVTAALGATSAESTLADQRVAYLRHRRRTALRAVIGSPLSTFRTTPVYSLLVSVPLGLAAAALAINANLAEPTMAAMVDRPIPTTTWLVAIPLLVALVPLSYFHERKRARERHFARRFPDTLSVLASANKMGIGFVDALSLIARWSSGAMATEMQTLRNDLRWNFDTRRGLRRLADRVGVPQLSRTMTLIAEGVRSSTDVSAVLSIAARDTNERFKLDKERRQELTPYIAVVMIGFGVFLLVVVMLDAAYLTPIAQAQAEATTAAEQAVTGQSLPLTLTNVPVEAYKTVFLHAAIIQALGSGILAGKLAEDDAFSGLKYSIVLIVVAIGAFAFI